MDTLVFQSMHRFDRTDSANRRYAQIKILENPTCVKNYFRLLQYQHTPFAKEKIGEILYCQHMYRSKSDLGIFFIGDSHADFYSRGITVLTDETYVPIHCLWKGPRTLYMTVRKPISDLITDEDISFMAKYRRVILIVSLGEIDIRRHWSQYIFQDQVTEYISDRAEEYICWCEGVHEHISKQLGSGLVKIAIATPPPPRNRRDVCTKDWGTLAPIGTDEERACYTKTFCGRVSHKLDNNPSRSIKLLDFYRYLVNSRGFIRRIQVDNTVHAINSSHMFSSLIQGSLQEWENLW